MNVAKRKRKSSHRKTRKCSLGCPVIVMKCSKQKAVAAPTHGPGWLSQGDAASAQHKKNAAVKRCFIKVGGMKTKLMTRAKADDKLAALARAQRNARCVPKITIR